MSDEKMSIEDEFKIWCRRIEALEKDHLKHNADHHIGVWYFIKQMGTIKQIDGNYHNINLNAGEIVELKEQSRKYGIQVNSLQNDRRNMLEREDNFADIRDKIGVLTRLEIYDAGQTAKLKEQLNTVNITDDLIKLATLNRFENLEAVLRELINMIYNEQIGSGLDKNRLLEKLDSPTLPDPYYACGKLKTEKKNETILCYDCNNDYVVTWKGGSECPHCGSWNEDSEDKIEKKKSTIISISEARKNLTDYSNKMKAEIKKRNEEDYREIERDVEIEINSKSPEHINTSKPLYLEAKPEKSIGKSNSYYKGYEDCEKELIESIIKDLDDLNPNSVQIEYLIECLIKKYKKMINK